MFSSVFKPLFRLSKRNFFLFFQKKKKKKKKKEYKYKLLSLWTESVDLKITKRNLK